MLKRLFLLPIMALLIGCRQLPPPPAVEFTIEGGNITLVNGQMERLHYDVQNFDENYPYEEYGPIVWTSSNTDVATIEDSLLYAVGVGTSIITATLREKYTDSIVCTVTEAYPAYFYLYTTEMVLDINETSQLTWNIGPDYALQEIAWTTSDSNVATVSSDGFVTAKKHGTATIKGKTLNDLVGECVVTVTDRSPLQITVEREHIDLNVDEKISSNFEVSPSYFNRETKFEVTSNNPDLVKVESWYVATLSNSGKFEIKGIAPGDATITLSFANGVSASVTVSVTHVLPESLMFDVSRVSILKGSDYFIDYEILPEGTTEKTLTWTSDNPSIAEVFENGQIVAHEPGYTTVRATTTNNISQEVAVTVYSERNKHILPEAEPNDTLQTANVIYNIGVTIAGKSANLADKDYYRIVANEDDKLHIDFRANRASYSDHFSVRILDDAGELEAVVPLIDAGLVDSRREIDFAVPKSGTYYIEIMITDTAPIKENNHYHLYVYTF